MYKCIYIYCLEKWSATFDKTRINYFSISQIDLTLCYFPKNHFYGFLTNYLKNLTCCHLLTLRWKFNWQALNNLLLLQCYNRNLKNNNDNNNPNQIKIVE